MMAVLAEMVRQYPPEWDQAVVWPNGSGGFYAATILGPDKPATSFSHDSIAVVRTLVADLDAQGEVTGGRLVEFASPDPLDPSSLADYVKQWLGDDFGNTKVLAAEYTIGYAAQQAILHLPEDAPSPTSLHLMEVPGVNKTAAGKWYCWVSDVDEWGETCVDLPPDDEACGTYTDVHITCVYYDDDSGGGDGDGGGNDGCPPEGCNGGGGSGGSGGGEDEEEGESGTQFELTCTSPVTRGAYATCTVHVSNDDDVTITADNFIYDWISSTGASLTGMGNRGNYWTGKATGTATITVSVLSEGFTAQKLVDVTDRTGTASIVPVLDATPQYTAPLGGRAGRLGYYEVPSAPPTDGLMLTSGDGPWEGHSMVKKLPPIASELHISKDYTPHGNGPKHPGANSSCPGSLTGLSGTGASYFEVNDFCNSLPGLWDTRADIEAHEREHENGYNQCLKTSPDIAELVAMSDRTERLADEVLMRWKRFYNNVFALQDPTGRAFVSSDYFWIPQPSTTTWVQAMMTIRAHGSPVNCL